MILPLSSLSFTFDFAVRFSVLDPAARTIRHSCFTGSQNALLLPATAAARQQRHSGHKLVHLLPQRAAAQGGAGQRPLLRPRLPRTAARSVELAAKQGTRGGKGGRASWMNSDGDASRTRRSQQQRRQRRKYCCLLSLVPDRRGRGGVGVECVVYRCSVLIVANSHSRCEEDSD